MNKKRLVFHFWIPMEMTEFQKKIVKIHLFCLKQYKHIFNDVIFTLPKENFHVCEKMLIDIGFEGNCSFIIRKEETPLYECETFKNYIYDDLDGYDGLTFFAHMKGITDERFEEENVFKWISFMYYMNLNYVKDAEKLLLSNKIFYGTLLEYNEIIPNKFHWDYSGAFYWLNTKFFKKYIMVNNIVKLDITNRNDVELIFGDIIPITAERGGSFHEYVLREPSNMYFKADNTLKSYFDFLGETIKNEFYDFYNKIKKNINEEKI